MKHIIHDVIVSFGTSSFVCLSQMWLLGPFDAHYFFVLAYQNNHWFPSCCCWLCLFVCVLGVFATQEFRAAFLFYLCFCEKLTNIDSDTNSTAGLIFQSTKQSHKIMTVSSLFLVYRVAIKLSMNCFYIILTKLISKSFSFVLFDGFSKFSLKCNHSHSQPIEYNLISKAHKSERLQSKLGSRSFIIHNWLIDWLMIGTVID